MSKRSPEETERSTQLRKLEKELAVKIRTRGQLESQTAKLNHEIPMLQNMVLSLRVLLGKSNTGLQKMPDAPMLNDPKTIATIFPAHEVEPGMGMVPSTPAELSNQVPDIDTHPLAGGPEFV